MKRIVLAPLFVRAVLWGALLLAPRTGSSGAIFTSQKNGSWRDTNTWGALSWPVSGDDVSVGHTVAVNTQDVCAILRMTGGDLQINGGKSLTVEHDGTWSNSASLSQGGTLVNAGAFVWDGSGTKTVNLVFQNNGTVTHAGTGPLALGGTFVNPVSSLYETTADAAMSGSGAFENRGTFRKSGGAGTNAISCTFHNFGGTIQVQTGTVYLTGGGIRSNGTYAVSEGAVLDLSANANVIYKGVLTSSGSGTVQWTTGQLESGSSDGTFAFTNSGFHWRGGTLGKQYGGHPTLRNTGLLWMEGTATNRLENGTLVNDGTIRQADGKRVHLNQYEGSGHIVNGTNGLYDIQGDGLCLSGAGGDWNGDDIFDNYGTFAKSAGTGTCWVTCEFQNWDGTLQVQTGTLVLTSEGTKSNGHYEVASDAALEFQLTDDAYFKGTLRGSGGGPVKWTSGWMRRGANQAELDFPNGGFWWYGGDMGETWAGAPSIHNRGLMILAGTNLTTLNRGTILNSGTVRQHAVRTLYLNGTDGDNRFYNLTGGVYEVAGDGLCLNGGGDGNYGNHKFVNSGRFVKTGGGGTNTVACKFDSSSGAIGVETGTLAFSSIGTVTNTACSVAGGATLNLCAGGSMLWKATLRQTCTGQVQVTGGTIAAGSVLDLAPSNGFAWSGGTLCGIVTNDGLLVVDGPATKTASGLAFWQSGHVRHSSTGLLSLAGSQFYNRTNAVYEVETNGTCIGGSGGHAFYNDGVFRKTAGSGTSTVSAAFVNSNALIEVLTGKLQFNAFTFRSGTIRLNGNAAGFSDFTLPAGSRLEGGGAVAVGTLVNAGYVIPGPTGSLLSLSGNFTQSAGGLLPLEIGGTNAADFSRLAVGGSATLGGTLSAVLTNGYAPLPADRFDFLTAASRSGAFASTNLPTLDAGRFWVLKYKASGASLRIGTDADTDGDGLPDDWELAWLGGLDYSDGRGDDFDGDGVTDARECALNSDPADPESNLDRASLSGTVSYAGSQSGAVHVAVNGPLTNSALVLDGAGDYADLPDGIWFASNFTVEAWVYLQEYRYWCRLFDFGNGTPNHNVLFALSNQRTGKPRFEILNGGTSMGTLDAPDALPLNRWVHLAITRSATSGTVTVYLDGVPWFGGAYGAPPQVVRTSCFVGKSLWSGDEQTKGMIDEFRIWSYARSEADIRTGMNGRLTGREPGLRGYWRFDQGAVDLGTNRQHGVLYGNATNAPSGPALAIADVTLPAPGAYTATNLPLPRTYGVQAFLDANGNGVEDPSEPRAAWSNNPVAVTGVVTGVDITLAEGQDADSDGLSDAWERGYGRYQLIGYTGTWAQAFTDATNRGGHLATIASFDEWIDILRVVGASNLLGRATWIGGSDEQAEGTWKWVTGENWSYTRWAPGEPGADDYAMIPSTAGTNLLWAEGALLSNAWYLLEIGYYTNPTNADTDGDGIADNAEIAVYGTIPSQADTDGDGIGDGEEITAGADGYVTDPLKADTDGDSLSDWEEVNAGTDGYLTDPTKADTDADGVADGEESSFGADGYKTNPSARDTDADGAEDLEETTPGADGCVTDPGRADTDGDGVSDGLELAGGTNPLDPESPSARAVIAGAVTYTGAVSGTVLVEALVPAATNGVLNLTGSGNGHAAFRPGIYFGTNFTFESWVNLREYKDWSRLFDFGLGAGSDNIYLAFDSGGNNVPMLSIRRGGSYNELYAPEPLPLNRWIHLAVTRGDDGIVRLYLNGVLWTSASMQAPIALTRTSNYIGRSNWSSDPYANAQVDEVRIWNYARTEGDLRADMARRLTGREAGLSAYWRFDVNASDLSTNGMHGVVTNTATVSRPGGVALVQARATLAAPGPYAITNVCCPRPCEVRAWLDADANGRLDPADPQGLYAGNPLPLAGDTNGIAVALADGYDADADGLSDAYENGYGRYQLVGFTGTWAQASANATNRGGHLATITSLDEWLDVARVVGATNLYGRSIWIGGTDEQAEGAWKWVTGETWSYARWASGEPNNSGNEDYAMIWPSTGTNLLWSDWTAAGVNPWYLLEAGSYTRSTNADTDGDGLSDGAEVLTYGSDPVRLDTDGDGLADGAEVLTHGTNPANSDTDGDGLADGYELTVFGSDPLKADSDADGFPDYAEWEVLTNPTNPASYLKIGSFGQGGTNWVLTLDTSTGVHYHILSASNLMPPVTWVTGATVNGTGRPVSVTNSPASNPAFYKIRAGR